MAIDPTSVPFIRNTLPLSRSERGLQSVAKECVNAAGGSSVCESCLTKSLFPYHAGYTHTSDAFN